TSVRGSERTGQRWGVTLLEEARIHSEPKLLSAAPFAFTTGTESAPSLVESFVPELSESDIAVRVVESVGASTGGISLADAKVVVSGGRGVGSSEAFAQLEELAALLD